MSHTPGVVAQAMSSIDTLYSTRKLSSKLTWTNFTLMIDLSDKMLSAHQEDPWSCLKRGVLLACQSEGRHTLHFGDLHPQMRRASGMYFNFQEWRALSTLASVLVGLKMAGTNPLKMVRNLVEIDK